VQSPRACLKIAFWQMCVTICGRFVPNEGRIAGYVTWIWRKYHAKWGVHMSGMNFQTRSRLNCNFSLPYIGNVTCQFAKRAL